MFRYILLILLLFFIFRFIARVLFPYLYFNSKKNVKQQKTGNKKEGEITIDYIEQKKSKKEDNNDEYIEFEEVS